MAKSTATPSREILAAALQGLEAQRERLDEQISQVRALIGGRSGRPVGALTHSSSVSGERRKRVLTPEARKRIAAAQKRRWAAFRKNQA
jgi:hypothetical protein